MMRPIAIIPARGGSKRVPRKNIVPFFGHPLLSYTIHAALNSKVFSKVIVSTEDPEIGKVAEQYGAEFILRPAEFATDKAGLIEVSLHVLETLEKTKSCPEAFCQLMPNIPLRRAEDISNQYEAFEKNNRQFQISVMPFLATYPQWALKRGANGKGDWYFGEKYLIPSQELDQTFAPTGAMWWARTDAFRKQKKFYGEGFAIEPMDPIRAIDIDTQEDLDLAEVFVRGLESKHGISPLEPIQLSTKRRAA